jgi:pantoate--beta-alanine ligase
MQILRNKNALRSWIAIMRSQRKSVAFAPTMGALHEGHLSLVKLGQQKCSLTLASIFINPKQFGANEDLDKYPRTEAEDLKRLEEIKTSAVYIPSVEDIYPDGFSTSVSVGKLATILCGKSRIGHFDGVATVVSKLLMQVLPDIAIFGEKDFQQLQVIKRMAQDLDIPVTIESGATLREADGLAMSSRNRYLSAADRAVAPKLFGIMNNCRLRMLQASEPFNVILDQAKIEILASGFDKVDYLECVDATSLLPVMNLKNPARLLVAAYLGETRLIDNISV